MSAPNQRREPPSAAAATAAKRTRGRRLDRWDYVTLSICLYGVLKIARIVGYL